MRNRFPTRIRALVVLVVLVSLCSAGLVSAEDPAKPEEARADDETHRETITVAARGSELADKRIGTTTTVISPEELVAPADSLTGLVAAAPGVAANGQGGLLQVFSIRGLSRQRVMTQVAGARIVDDRRAGATATWIDPNLVGAVEVLRGPASVLHGSGAVGGLVRILPRWFDATRLVGGYSSAGDESYQVGGSGNDRWSVGLSRRVSGDAEAADGTRLYSRFEQYSAVLQRRWVVDERTHEFLIISAHGTDIGKPNTDFPERVTTYPTERHHLVRLSSRRPDGPGFEVFAHLHDLETEVVAAETRSVVDNSSLDFGARWEDRARAGERVSIGFGAEVFGRSGVDAREVQQVFGASPSVTRTDSLDDARSLELGAFVTARGQQARLAWETGARITSARRSGERVKTVDDASVNGFAGLVWTFRPGLQLRGSLDSGLRVPTLTELFFEGTTGRGEVIGNPDLDPERTLTTEVGLYWVARRVVTDLTVFSSEIDDYIERIEVTPDVLTYVNRGSGRIRGLELEGLYLSAEGWRVGWSAHRLNGRTDAGVALGDVPPDELSLSLGREHGRLRWEARTRFRDRKTDPGDGELALDSALVVGGAVGWRLAPDLELGLSLENLTDEDYVPSADRKALPAAGRSVALRLVWSGPGAP